MENSTKSAFESFDGLAVTESVKSHLLKSAKWAKFLAIIGFIGSGLMIVSALVMLTLSSRIGLFPGLPFSPSLFGLLYLVFAGIGFMSALHMYNFGSKMIRSADSNSSELFEMSMKGLGSWFQLTGILTIVVISLYILIILFAIIVAS